MNRYFRALAIDYDGTLAREGQPGAEVLAAVSEARQAGLRIILVTGRILDELRGTFAAADQHFDAIVGENGAVMSIEGSEFELSAPVEPELAAALALHSVTFRRGKVLLATTVDFEDQVQSEVHRLGLECQLVRNRSELMVLPPGVSKGTGLSRALDTFGISLHNTLGVGDAENDHSLLAMSELGIAVANAVDGLKRHADLVLDKPNGEGIAQLLYDIVSDRLAPRSTRRRITLGYYAGGTEATIPCSEINLLVTGRSKSGKSYAAGVVAEQLIEQRYSVCLIDPEGDYISLSLRNGLECLCIDANPGYEQLPGLFKNSLNSVIVDLSLSDPAGRTAYVDSLLGQLAKQRRDTGLPHWLIIDEAQNMLGAPGALDSALKSKEKGICLVTYQPQALGESRFKAMDYVLAVAGGKHADGPDPLQQVAQLCHLSTGLDESDGHNKSAWLIDLGDNCQARTLELARRRTIHVRHRHKYQQGKLPHRLRFLFRGRDGLGSLSAGNAMEFCDLVRESPADTVAFHAERSDFSRWVSQALQEPELASRVRLIEDRYLGSPRCPDDLAALSRSVAGAITNHYR